MTQLLNLQVIASAARQEYTPALPIYDVREYHPQGPIGICVIGGFIGELLMSMNALNDAILANPNLNDFKLNSESMERLIEDWMKAGEFPEGTCVVKITEESSEKLKNMLSSKESSEADRFIASKLMDTNSH